MNDLRTLPAQWCGAWAVGLWGLLTPQENAAPRKPTRSRRAAYFLGVLFATISLAKMSAAMAFATPAAGSFGFDVYDIVVNQILGGPIGFVGGVALIVWGGSQVIKNWVITILAIIAGTIIIRADTLVTSLGATI